MSMHDGRARSRMRHRGTAAGLLLFLASNADVDQTTRNVNAFTPTNQRRQIATLPPLIVAAADQHHHRRHPLASFPSGSYSLLIRNAQSNRYKVERSNSYRSYCPRCHRPQPTCLCHALPPRGPIALPHIQILILQHPREARKRKRTSTVPLIGLCLEKVTICVGTKFGCAKEDEKEGCLCPEALREILNNIDNKEEVLLLYPGEMAMPMQQESWVSNEPNKSKQSSEPTASISSPKTTLIVLDGTWAQTQSMYQSSPCLQQLPQYMFVDDTESLFDPIRQEPAGHCTSTLEAVARALRIVGGDNMASREDEEAAMAAADVLETSLRAMVAGQMRYAQDEEKSQPRSKNYARSSSNNNDVNNNIDVAANNSHREGNKARRKMRKRRQAQLSLPRPMSEEEVEASKIRFIYVAHLG